MRKKFTYKDHKEQMLAIVNRPKQTTDRRGTLGRIINAARAKRTKV